MVLRRDAQGNVLTVHRNPYPRSSRWDEREEKWAFKAYGSGRTVPQKKPAAAARDASPKRVVDLTRDADESDMEADVV